MNARPLIIRRRALLRLGTAAATVAALAAVLFHYVPGRDGLGAAAHAEITSQSRPLRQPPPLLGERDVAAGLAMRLQQMRARHAARELQRSHEPPRLASDREPPRAPAPPPRESFD